MKNVSIKSLILLAIVVLSLLFFFQSGVLAQTASPFDLVNLKLFVSGDIAAYEKIKIVEAWERINQEKASNPTLSLSRVILGIFDTGIDIVHPEFAGALIDTPLSKDTEKWGHGTQVAGIIGANNISAGSPYIPPQMNGILSGVNGLPYAVRIRASGDLADFTTRDGFRQFVELDRLARTPGGLHAINGSFGEPLCSKLTAAQKALYFLKDFSCYKQEEFLAAKDIYRDLVNQYSNILFVFGAGNDGIDAQFNLPGGGIASSNAITVGATNLTDGRAIFGSTDESNFGSSVNISAPGEKIYAPAPMGKGNFPADTKDYDNSFSGTSASAPMVTGVAGLIKAIRPELTPSQIKQILISTADPIVTDQPIGPRLNALNAVCHPLVLNCVPSQPIILQPGPETGKDIWTTSVFSYAPSGGGPGGGLNNEALVVGGFGDHYYSLLQFNLMGMPAQAQSAQLELFPFTQRGVGTTALYLDRIIEFWDWRIQGTGADRLRLWWTDKPQAVQWISTALLAPVIGEWYSIDITDLYNAWQNGTHPNYGLQLRPVSIDNRWSEFYSSDYAGDPTLRPRLVVTPIRGIISDGEVPRSLANPPADGRTQLIVPEPVSRATSTAIQ